MKEIVKPVVCIIGSGIGGGTLAIALAKRHAASILMVDVDAINLPDREIGKIVLEAKSVGNDFNVPNTRFFGFGGSSNRWHGVLTMLDPEDWEEIDRAAGRCISKSIMDQYYREAASIFGFGATELSENKDLRDRSSQLNSVLERSGFKKKEYVYSLHPLRTKERLVAMAEEGYDISFQNGSVALRLVESAKDENKVESVILRTEKGLREVKADFFVLALGALETPRLLLQSVAERSLTLQLPLLGRSLTDHPWAVIGEIRANGRVSVGNVGDLKIRESAASRRGYRMVTLDPISGAWLNHAVSFKPIFFGRFESFKSIFKKILSSPINATGVVKLFRTFRSRDVLAGLFFLTVEKLGASFFARRALVFCYLQQPYRENSAVALSEDIDKFGRVIPEIHWIVDQAELKAIETIQRALGVASAKEGFYDFLPYSLDVSDLSSGSHHAGTARIGRTPNDGVVDSDLKLFEKDNVFVCDLSIFPSFGNSNPSFTLGAFSFRLADYMSGLILGGRHSMDVVD